MLESTMNTYDSCVEWVKDLWKWVTGDDKNGQNVSKETDKLKSQVKDAETRMNSSIDKFQNKLNNHAQGIDNTAKTKSDEIN